jgi:hypothetical protein
MKSEAGAADQRILGELEESAEKAFSRLGLITHSFRFGGHEFVMRFAGTRLASLMTRALAHLVIEQTTQPNPFTIDCWDLTATGLGFPLSQTRAEVRKQTNDNLQIEYQEWIRALNAYFPVQNRAFFCIENAEEFQVQLLGASAYDLFNQWLSTVGWQFVHAAAVGTEQGGVLIVGYGGAGKSTLAFSTLNSPLRYLSDDYCVLTPENPPRVLALYNSGKLNESSFRLIPHLRDLSGNMDDPKREKDVFFLQERFPRQQIHELTLRAIVLPQIGATTTFLAPADRKEALHILVESTFRQLSKPSLPGFLRLLRSIRGLPAHYLHLERDYGPAHQLLLQLCQSSVV